ncbi:NAD(P)H-dependent oxidoreductase subunit E [Streptomonospora wellingtoniae]|uniref:NAD(P)H-dependent oxidoreductase subunit E n=1 Tax=Streptomonospora wellingtoniae TaxID=3075544 RepID=A0ABU2KX56_9ACTN|nr:NAD(P)H-dependent oxidoreductase subunit E [Streptomonospora sp. DSM 45055]MDT0303825.1 NAD(P)H-dependent oxidoreductase subunit E [Streptomonospora sp. DSM 45055]
MDLHFLDAVPEDSEREAVDAVLGPPESGWDGGTRQASDLRFAEGGHAARGRRDLLLPALHAVNDRVGWISPAALDYICRRLTIPPAEAYGVATFYAMFSLKQRPRRVVHVCTDIACAAKGSEGLCAALTERAGGPGTEGGEFTWHESPCLGLCERAPAAVSLEAGDPPRYSVAAPAAADDIVPAAGEAPAAETAAGAGTPGPSANGHAPSLNGGRPRRRATFSPATLPGPAPEPPAGEAVPQAGDPDLVLLRRIGVVDPASLDDYRANGGYAALREALRMGPSAVIREVSDSGLVGRGGAAFPTGRKWDGTAKRPETPRYVICNADESEPGTFKDRVIMEGDPFSVIEALTIAGFANNANHGYIYIRGEYPRALSLLENAIELAHARNLLGRDILGSGFDFDIEIRRGAGAYICGEETAIFNSIEGLRGEPRSKPPFPVERGVFGKPTAINNVETLVNVLPIMMMGGPAYAAIGTGRSTGPKLFCVSGSVERPGVYEVPFGASLRDLMEMCGGVGTGPEGEPRLPRAVLLGGAAGGFVRGDELDIPLTFEGAREAGATLGSGVILVLDDTVDLAAILVRIAAFFRDESCGQCVPCRVGTVRQEEALVRLAQDAGPRRTDIALLREVGEAMRDASICGLGQTAWNAVESAIDRLGVFGPQEEQPVKEAR